MKTQKYKIRYNTAATSDKNCWRVIDSENNETLVDDIIIQTGCCTTKDWIEELQQYKYHISCEGVLSFIDNKAVIS